MLLKKQTVWLLTMLSLIIVLSVYYLVSPEQSATNIAYQNEQEENEASNNGEDTGETQDDQATSTDQGDDTAMEDGASDEGTAASSIASDELFTQMRLNIIEQRDQLAEEYTDVIASANVSADLQAQAMEKREQLLSLEMAEQTLETLIMSMGYEDVLVNTMGEDIKVIVKADELSREEAVKIMNETENQLGADKRVAVSYEPSK
jgi:stage III sporulation protein AH